MAIHLARTPKKALPSACGQAERSREGMSRVSPDYGNPPRTHAEEGRAERSGQADA
jgi:hypothetical protein